MSLGADVLLHAALPYSKQYRALYASGLRGAGVRVPGEAGSQPFESIIEPGQGRAEGQRVHWDAKL